MQGPVEAAGWLLAVPPALQEVQGSVEALPQEVPGEVQGPVEAAGWLLAVPPARQEVQG